MADIVFVLIAVVFFVSCIAYVRACERLAGRGPAPDAGETGTRAETGTREAART